MIAGFKPYPKYIASGLQWLGNVPAHWQLLRLGVVLQERKEINEYGEITHVLSVVKTRGVIPYEEKGNIGNKKSDNITRYKIVRPGDIVINSMNVIIGSSGLSKYTGCLSPVYYVLRHRMESANAYYLAAIFQNPSFYRRLIRLGNGILSFRMRIPMELLKCEVIPLPPASEQAAIVYFLGKTVTKIESIIAAKEKIIALLEEQKRAVIRHTITRGLDLSVALKPSGSLFIGDIPTHWETKRLGALGYFSASGIDKIIVAGEPKVKMINYLDIYNNDSYSLSQNNNYMIVSCPHWKKEIHAAQKGDMFFTPSSETAAEIGLSAVAIEDMHDTVYSYHVIRFRPAIKMYLPYQKYWCNNLAVMNQFSFLCKGTTRKIINRGEFRSVIVPVPPYKEQIAIAEYLDNMMTKINAAAKCAHREITLLREYRNSLVANAVTGKIDVRNFAAYSRKSKKRL